MKLFVPLVLVVLAVAGCRQASEAPLRASTASTPRQKASPFRIVDVSADRDRITPREGTGVAITFTVDAPAEVALHIYDGRDALIYRSVAKQVAAGVHSLAWTGLDGTGEAVPPEAYHYVLRAENASGTVIHDLTDATGGEALLVKEPKWDAAQGQLTFRLDRPSRINVRFGLRDGPFVRTAVDWVARDAGNHTVAWDGWDASHVMKLSDHPMLSPTVRAYTLPENTIFVGGDADVVRFAETPALGQRQKQVKRAKTRMFFHADQPLETRGDIPVELSLLGSPKRDAEGRHVVSGLVPIRLDVPASVRAHVLNRRFEPVFFTDGIFVFETEVGVLPMTWHWDSTVVNPGEHFITANIRGYEGNYGTATLRLWVEPSQPAIGTVSGLSEAGL